VKKSVFLLIPAVGFVVAACNLPGGNAPQADMMTAAAMTVQAAIAVTPLASPTAESQVANATPTSHVPAMLSVGDVTNCRSGPGRDYERIVQIQPGQQVEIIGVFPPDYYVVNAQAGVCWIAAEFSTPTGNYQTVPTVTAPPTPQGNIPEAPTFPKNGWTYFCYGAGLADITLTWNDKANNETGYRILRNGEVVVELPANSTNFAETINLASGQSVGYQVQAYNPSGASSSIVATMTCP
jgi:hypothetical protein